MTHVLLVGAGYMAKEYVKVLKALDVSFDVVGRGKESAEAFQKELGVSVQYGGVEKNFDQSRSYSHAIIATTLESLEENTLFLLNQGVSNILVEKPGAVTQEGISRIAALAEEKGANVYIAYNRRFYASVIDAKKRIAEDGGLTSFHFEFTEWGHMIETLNKTQFQFENWFIGNSTHVLDTAFYFGGVPKEVRAFVQGKTNWHPHGCIYTGAGITEKEILFSYNANWAAPGSWKLELLTNLNRYIFRPFEKLHIQKLGKIEVEEVQISDELDIQFKPGAYRQLEAFCFKEMESNLLSIFELEKIFKSYMMIKNGEH